MVSGHNNAYVVGKGFQLRVHEKNGPNFRAFSEDLAGRALTFGVKANHDPPSTMHLNQEKSTIDWSKGEMASLKCAYECKAKGIKQKADSL
ncbi:hypothetical protein RRG08_050492 [Elysia crispata]|uniref:Uncharacterized protein n=1 Tax=Elysia crispata TaxID=231223 RepID=A0AAE0Z9W2_9GAST|nr:hypothetical protein RRG08_050492 [Elysia crispata]